MHESDKLAEAEYFYAEMQKDFEDRLAFNFKLSAFLAAARSVLQYAHAEAKAKAGGQAWYDGQVASNPIVGFFKDKRNINIHVKPVEVRADIGIEITETLQLSEALTIEVFEEGRLVGRHRVESPRPAADQEVADRPAIIRSVYRFADWSGPEDLIALSRTYLDQLASIVADGHARGLLT